MAKIDHLLEIQGKSEAPVHALGGEKAAQTGAIECDRNKPEFSGRKDPQGDREINRFRRKDWLLRSPPRGRSSSVSEVDLADSLRAEIGVQVNTKTTMKRGLEDIGRLADKLRGMDQKQRSCGEDSPVYSNTRKTAKIESLGVDGEELGRFSFLKYETFMPKGKGPSQTNKNYIYKVIVDQQEEKTYHKLIKLRETLGQENRLGGAIPTQDLERKDRLVETPQINSKTDAIILTADGLSYA
nr:unnamed protein product [Callosobruchus chinensis]